MSAGAMAGIPKFKAIKAEVEGHRLELIVSGKDRLAALLSMIDTAKESLRMYFYIFADDAAANRVKHALIAACGRGVKVWLLIDGFGSADCGDECYAPLQEAGVVFCRFYPKWGRRYLLRNHQKIVIADGRTALIGGANIADNYFSDDPAGKSWHDLFLKIEGPAVLRLQRYFDGLRRWMLGRRPRLRGLVNLLGRRSEKTGLLRWVYGGPFRRPNPYVRALRHDLHAARRIDMIQAYFSPNWAMLRRIERDAKRGSSRVITAAHSDNNVTVAASRHTYRRLLKRGVRVLEYQPQMLHAKLMVLDDVTYIGSPNFDMRSFYINCEVSLRIEDAGFAEKMRGFIDAHEPFCEEITREAHRARSTPFARLRWLVSYFIVSGFDFGVTRGISLRRV